MHAANGDLTLAEPAAEAPPREPEADDAEALDRG